MKENTTAMEMRIENRLKKIEAMLAQMQTWGCSSNSFQIVEIIIIIVIWMNLGSRYPIV
jgi:hypothetical protein